MATVLYSLSTFPLQLLTLSPFHPLSSIAAASCQQRVHQR